MGKKQVKKKHMDKKSQKNYEVISLRFDVPPAREGSFEAESDEAATKIFYHDYVADPHFGFDRLVLVEVVQERKERFIEASGPKDRGRRQ